MTYVNQGEGKKTEKNKEGKKQARWPNKTCTREQTRKKPPDWLQWLAYWPLNCAVLLHWPPRWGSRVGRASHYGISYQGYHLIDRDSEEINYANQVEIFCLFVSFLSTEGVGWEAGIRHKLFNCSSSHDLEPKFTTQSPLFITQADQPKPVLNSANIYFANPARVFVEPEKSSAKIVGF